MARELGSHCSKDSIWYFNSKLANELNVMEGIKLILRAASTADCGGILDVTETNQSFPCTKKPFRINIGIQTLLLHT
jgi:hypothetical protein